MIKEKYENEEIGKHKKKKGRENMQRKWKEKGVTLIALVITIIVLIILAGVAINTLVGENGIITQAQKAKENTELAEKDEEELLEDLVSQIDYSQANTNLGIVKVGETAVRNSTMNGQKGSYANPVIPKGFKAVDTNIAKWKDENGYQFGLVIEDDTKDEITQSSQFVWIPVEDYQHFHLIEGYLNGYLTTYLSRTENASREAGASKTEKIPQLPNSGKNALLGTNESINMYRSISTYGGFYIARYEAGIAGTVNSTQTNDSNKQIQDGSIKPISKEKVGVWNFIAWGGTKEKEATDGEFGNDRQDGAVKVARSMYNNPIEGIHNKNTTVKSTLCYGVQWDAIMNFIDKNYETGTCDSNSFLVNSSNQGNYSGNIATTGSRDEYNVKNIYDLAGNVYEWTMEAFHTEYRVTRGGNWNVSATYAPASQRGNNNPDNSYDSIGFRVALYL